MRGLLVDFRFNADPVALKLLIHTKIVFRAGTGSCLPSLKCTRNALCVAVTDSFVLTNVSHICFDKCFHSESAMLTSPIHGIN